MSGSLSSGYTVQLANDTTDAPPHTFLLIILPDGTTQRLGFAPSVEGSPFGSGRAYSWDHHYDNISVTLPLTMHRYGHMFKSDDHKKAADAIAAEMLG